MSAVSEKILLFAETLQYFLSKSRAFLVLIFLTFLIFQVGANLAEAQKKDVEQTKREISPKTSSVKCSPEYNFKILQVRTYLAKVQSYKNLIVRGKIIIDLNSLLWECDEDFSRSSFLSFWQKLGSEIVSAKVKKNDTATNTQDEIRKLNGVLSTNKYLQQYLILRLQKLDKSLAKQLSKNFTSAEKGFVHFLSLEGNYNTNSLSSQQLNEIRQVMRSSPISEMTLFLFDLRKGNSEVADRLFLELLNLSKNDPNLSFNNLMLLGTYLYTSRFFLNSEDDSYSYSYLPARGVQIIDLTAKRSIISGNSTIPYLDLMTRFLLNPVTNSTEKTQRYVFGRIMLNHIVSDAPELANSMLQALQIHFDGVADKFKEESFYETFRKINSPSETDYYEKNLKDVEKTIGSDNRDDKAVRLANALYNKGQYERIEKVTEYISNIGKKNSVLDVTRYTQAIKLIENNESDKAEVILRKITDASLKALVGFRLLQELQTNKSNSFNLTEQYIYSVIDNAKNSDDEYAPVLLLALAKIIYKKNESLGHSLIITAIKKLNDNENWNNPKWRVEIPTPTIGLPSIGFSMKKVQGLSVSESLDFLIKESETNLEEIISSIESEKVQSEAILLFVKYYLAEAKKNSIEVKNDAK